MVYQEQCDQCLEMYPADTLIFHRRHTWCQNCIMRYVYFLEDGYYGEGGDVNDIVELVKKEVRPLDKG